MATLVPPRPEIVLKQLHVVSLRVSNVSYLRCETVACLFSSSSMLHGQQALQTAGGFIGASILAEIDAIPSLDFVGPDVLRCSHLQIVCARPPGNLKI